MNGRESVRAQLSCDTLDLREVARYKQLIMKMFLEPKQYVHVEELLPAIVEGDSESGNSRLHINTREGGGHDLGPPEAVIALRDLLLEGDVHRGGHLRFSPSYSVEYIMKDGQLAESAGDAGVFLWESDRPAGDSKLSASA